VIVSVTEIESFLRCRYQWDLASFQRQSLMPIKTKPNLALGKAVHQALEQWAYQPQADPEQLFLMTAAATQDKIEAEYKRHIGTRPSDAEMSKFYQYVGQGQIMIRNYALRYKTPLPDGFRFVQPEQRSIIPIPGTPHFLNATMDGIVVDRKERLYPLERKTFSKMPEMHTLQNNHQFLCYLWQLTQMNIGHVEAVLYDGLLVATKGDLDKLFLRVVLKRSQYELDVLGRELALVVTDMANDPQIYRNRRWEGCWDCSLESLCLAEYKNDNPDYVRRTEYTKREDN
jgi:hypothetical protein